MHKYRNSICKLQTRRIDSRVNYRTGGARQRKYNLPRLHRLCEISEVCIKFFDLNSSVCSNLLIALCNLRVKSQTQRSYYNSISQRSSESIAEEALTNYRDGNIRQVHFYQLPRDLKFVEQILFANVSPKWSHFARQML